MMIGAASRSVAPNPISFRRSFPLLLGIVLWFGCFYGLGAAGIFDRDEGLYATAARQMVESGDWIVPRIGPEVRFAKPPLIYWLQAPSILLFGPTPFAMRLPSGLAAALTALLLWWWAKRRGVERIGRLAAMIYVLCPLTMALVRQAIIDSLLTLCFTMTVIGWIEGYRGNRRGYLVMAIGMALATLAKSVMGLALPIAAFVLWLLLRRDGGEWRRVPWLPAIGLYLLIALPWHLVMWRVTGDAFIQEYFLSNQAQRFMGQKWGHVQPFWFYIPVLLVGMFPWSAFVPLAWWQNLQHLRQRERTDLSCAWAMWASWAVVIIGFFSLSKSKLPHYALPALPALALLAATRLDALWQTRGGLRIGEGVLFGVIGIAFGAVLTTVGVDRLMQTNPGAPLFGKTLSAKATDLVIILTPVVLAVGILLLLGTLIILARWKVTAQAVGAMGLMNVLLLVLLMQLGLPAWNNYDIAPLHNLGRRALPALERGEPLVIYALKPTHTSLRFVLGHTPQVTETDQPRVLQQVMNRAESGYILT
ncbi:MAG: glycosyltransferase family 39 protein, partial [Armatimonadota bacterium]|nr:glycosyltransferase family 39 protein [Armatimonadota bacterium]